MARRSTKVRLPARDSLSNLAASLGTGRDKAAHDAFYVAELPRDQVDAMYRGDWLARKVVDIVPYDSVRAWREWAGDRATVAAVERLERRLGLRGVVQRAMILGRLYGGGAVVIGTDESDPEALAAPLYPDTLRPGSLRFLHVVSRWQLAAGEVIRDPLDPCFGEPGFYTLQAGDRSELTLHPSRVVRFLGNPLPEPLLYGAQAWSDSVLQTLYDAIHGVALTQAGATSLVHEAKVDVVTVPNLSEHLSNAATTAQLSARFSYASAMKSINNLLLLGDGETWARQRIDFAGLPELVRTFLQVAAGAADVPVTRLLGQSPAGLSATGQHDTRNYYDMIAARQELDLRPRLERLDAVLLASAGVAPDALTFAFRPLWQLDASEKAAVALSKAQATAVYAGLNLWPASVTADLVRAQLVEDGTYPNAAAVLARDVAESEAATPATVRPGWAQPTVADFDPAQPRDPDGRWTAGGGNSARPSSGTRVAMTPTTGEETPEEMQRRLEKEERERLEAPLRGGSRPRPDGSVNVPLPLGAGSPSELEPAVVPEAPASTSPPSPGGTPNDVLRGFTGPKSLQKWQNQMTERGWTAQDIEEAIANGPKFAAPNRVTPGNTATRYVHPRTGRSVVIENETGRVIQLGGDGFGHY